MSTTDLKRAEALAGLFTAPATAVPDQATSPAARPSRGKRPARTLSVVEEPGAGESSPATAVAEAVGVLDTVIVIEPGGTPAEAAGELLEEADASHPTDDFDEDESAVEAMSTVITIPTDEEADELHEMAAEAAAVEQEAASQDEAPPQVDLVEVLTKKLGLKGAAERHNVPVAESTGVLLKSLDKHLALSGHPIVSRNALITTAAHRVISDPVRYTGAQGRDPQVAVLAVQGRVPTGMPADLRAAAYSVEPPLVVAHAMAAAVTELLTELQAQVSMSKRAPRRSR